MPLRHPHVDSSESSSASFNAAKSPHDAAKVPQDTAKVPQETPEPRNGDSVVVLPPLSSAAGDSSPLESAVAVADESASDTSPPAGRMRKVALQVSGSTGLSALIGIINGLVGARLFGLSLDPYYIAVQVPQLLGFIFGIRLSVFLVPWLISLRYTHGTRVARAREWQLALLFPAATAILLIGCYVWGEGVVRVFADGFSDAEVARSISLLRWTVPGGVAIVAMWILTSIAHSHQRFSGASLATMVNPAVTLLLLLTLGPRIGIEAVAMGFFLGPLAGCVPILWSLRGASNNDNHKPPAPSAFGTPHFGYVLLLGLMMTAQNQIPLLISRKLASHMEDGVITGLQYATQFSWMPVTILATSVGTALLPSLAKRHQESKGGFDGDALQDAARAMRVLAYLLVPLSFIILFYANPVVNLALAGGRFDKFAGIITSNAMQCYAPLIWIGAIWAILLKIVQARNALRVVFESLFIGTVIDVCFMVTFSDSDSLGYRAIPLANSANFLIATAYILWRTRHEVRLPLRQIGASMMILTLLSLAASGVSLGLSNWTTAPLTAVIFIAVYLGLAHVLHVREQEEFWTLVLGPKFQRFVRRLSKTEPAVL